MGHIPPELSDYIMDFLHDDRLALKACNLTSRNWRPAARYHLYRKVLLPSADSCRIFHQLLRDSPSLGSFVRDVGISSVNPLSVADDSQGAAKRNFDTPWSSILPALVGAERLDMSFLGLEHNFQTSLVGNLNTLTTLSLQYCRFPSFYAFVTMIHSFPSLKSCTLRGLSWNEGINAPSSATSIGPMSVCPNLTTLVLGRDIPLEPIVDWLLAEDACRDLVSFIGCCSSAVDAALLGQLLRSASSSIKALDLDWYSSSYHSVHLPLDFSLGPCPLLESLSMRCPIALNSTVPWVSSLLSQIDPSALKTLRLEIRLLGSLDGLDWSSLESRLLHADFAKLASVEIKVLIWHTATDLSNDVECAVRRFLPTLHSKGILRVICN